MADARQTRIQRILELRQRELDDARSELAAAGRRVFEKEEQHERAVQAWMEKAQIATRPDFASMEDFILEREHINTLRDLAERISNELLRARAREEVCRQKTVKAQQELKKIETWGENIAEERRQKESRQERKQTDEMAARTSGRNDEHS